MEAGVCKDKQHSLSLSDLFVPLSAESRFPKYFQLQTSMQLGSGWVRTGCSLTLQLLFWVGLTMVLVVRPHPDLISWGSATSHRWSKYENGYSSQCNTLKSQTDQEKQDKISIVPHFLRDRRWKRTSKHKYVELPACLWGFPLRRSG